MTDNTTLNPGAAGDVIRTLDRTGTGSPKTEVVQLDIGGGDGFGEKLVQGQVPVSLLDTEWPVDDDGVPLVNLSTGNAADPPTGTQLQQILNALTSLGSGLPPFSPQPMFQTTMNVAGETTAAYRINGANGAVVNVSGTFSGLLISFQGSYDGLTWFGLSYLILGTNNFVVTGGFTTLNAGQQFFVQLLGCTFLRATNAALTSGIAVLNIAPIASPLPSFLTAVGVKGNGGATLDAVIANGTAPTNMLAVGGQFNSTRLTLANLQSSALQLDSDGSLLVNLVDAIFQGAIAAAPPANAIQIALKAASANPANATAGNQVAPFGDQAGRLVVCSVNPRSLMKSTATTISATGATTIVAAQGAGVFADITQLIITTAGLAAQTITISDGTLSWIIDYPNAAVAPGQPLVISFNEVPLAATTANTAWTANQSVATACHYLVQFANKLA